MPAAIRQRRTARGKARSLCERSFCEAEFCIKFILFRARSRRKNYLSLAIVYGIIASNRLIWPEPCDESLAKGHHRSVILPDA
jgi:hypothetical protein